MGFNGFLYSTGRDSVLTNVVVHNMEALENIITFIKTNVFINNCKFIWNKSNAGLIRLDTPLSIAYFKNNEMLDNFGGIEIMESKYSMNNDKVYFLEFNTFKNNFRTIRVDITTSLYLEHNSFYNNTANFGGSLYITGNPMYTQIYNNTFDFNRANSGGAVFIDTRYEYYDQDDHGNITIWKNLFLDNSADFGGAISYTGTLLVTIVSCDFVLNYGDNEGGALHVDSWNKEYFFIANCLFVNNTAGFGGAAYLETDNISLVVTDSEFLNNNAVTGAAIAFEEYGRSVSKLNFVYNCVFENNVANYGASIVTTTAYLEVRDSNFKNNHALNSGSVLVCFSHGGVDIINCTIDENDEIFACFSPCLVDITESNVVGNCKVGCNSSCSFNNNDILYQCDHEQIDVCEGSDIVVVVIILSTMGGGILLFITLLIIVSWKQNREHDATALGNLLLQDDQGGYGTYTDIKMKQDNKECT
eukprot:TRINITY_DN4810_c2_g1_i1.p1 TRINITY_DN4810_c2_g1~~TRINITY_DN4810_c2_g1_i1.p1  ORF type:complete len:546 (+),score=88.31 TRINITY_DN4810_c2_g1_i1:221-1639(+)